MIKAYRRDYTLSIKGETYKNKSSIYLQDETEKKEPIISTVGWGLLNDFYKVYGYLCPFNVWNRKKGRQISFFDIDFKNRSTWDIKEWKEELKIDIIIKEEEQEVSINDILKYSDSNLAIRYLVERGLSVIR